MLRLGENFRGITTADVILRNYIKIKQGKNVVILTPYQIRKAAYLAKVMK